MRLLSYDSLMSFYLFHNFHYPSRHLLKFGFIPPPCLRSKIAGSCCLLLGFTNNLRFLLHLQVSTIPHFHYFPLIPYLWWSELCYCWTGSFSTFSSYIHVVTYLLLFHFITYKSLLGRQLKKFALVVYWLVFAPYTFPAQRKLIPRIIDVLPRP